MSPSIALALIIATFFTSIFAFFYITQLGINLAGELVTGVVKGVPVPARHRWLMLYSQWIFFGMGAVGVAVVAALVNITIAADVTAQAVKMVAYAAAFLNGIGALVWLTVGPNLYLYYRSVLRDAAVD